VSEPEFAVRAEDQPAWAEIVRRAESGESVVVIAHGDHVADVVPSGELDRLRETIEVLSDTDLVPDLQENLADAIFANVDGLTLCRECAANRSLPRIDLAAGLEGGGSVVFLEFAAPVDHAVAQQVAEQWRTAAGDAEFEEVRRAAQMIDAGYRKSTPWWGRCDLNEAHIRRAADGRLVLIDIFCMDGAALYGKILEDVAGVHRRIPRERMRYALDIPYIARENSAAEILALRKAWARAAG